LRETATGPSAQFPVALTISVEVVMLWGIPAATFLQVKDPQALEKLSFKHGLLVFSLHHWDL